MAYSESNDRNRIGHAGRVLRPPQSAVMRVLEARVAREVYYVTVDELATETGYSRKRVEAVMCEFEQFEHLGIERDEFHPDLAWTVEW